MYLLKLAPKKTYPGLGILIYIALLASILSRHLGSVNTVACPGHILKTVAPPSNLSSAATLSVALFSDSSRGSMSEAACQFADLEVLDCLVYAEL